MRVNAGVSICKMNGFYCGNLPVTAFARSLEKNNSNEAE